MEELGVKKWEHWDGEPYKSSTKYNESILIPRLERVLGEKDWEKVVTHNQGGEYGHYRYIGTHNVMSRLCMKNFGYLILVIKHHWITISKNKKVKY